MVTQNETSDTNAMTSPPPTAKRWWTWGGIVLAIAAWMTLLYSNGYAATIPAAIAIILSAIGCRHAPASLRRLAAAAIIASAVLIIVVAAFAIAINML